MDSVLKLRSWLEKLWDTNASFKPSRTSRSAREEQASFWPSRVDFETSVLWAVVWVPEAVAKPVAGI